MTKRVLLEGAVLRVLSDGSGLIGMSQVVVELSFNAGYFFAGVAGSFKLVGDVGGGTHKRHGAL